ncbi:class I ribonucleotide reductase maintenance protein YfaE [Pseudoalteromonas tunicata]|jgi:ferredoxin|uniref:Putative ferredoxin n=1 Tax=Pseudoalteromonas tunicata D2 TaxID=87626 RepID=A4C9Q6_9GAMM|nr:class I ribonucleotide reductase maintenance protein YfaE [Pseudoalteromonas tunicata]ATC94660.1 ferredoxin [Pseudoalteromonas tunicata]AXT30379.1 2Fe-2S ferredoxin-like protein [Pseudoalteromonas tunicata]EAR28114.1 putative ferredoxin [Pseudoalteromonas tunicata D2]MDP4982295.1 class I ribonucleotide reductase maintenance protein YfaE [Pseudoalteromonas tunicata]MDP5212024.1 class I ribonucleotide reductase maintenance protein YfaE [Pseudoalteromonas tunicata]
MKQVIIRNTDQILEYGSDRFTLLEHLEQHKIPVQYQCREGYCGACRCKLNSGSVEYLQEPLAFIRQGEILLCCAKPLEDVDLTLPHF